MKAKILLVAALIATASAKSKTFTLSRQKASDEQMRRLKQTVFDDTVVQDNPVNYLYTTAISIGSGTPNQTSDFLVDINYPVTVVWPVTCQYYFNASQNCSVTPLNLGQFYNST